MEYGGSPAPTITRYAGEKEHRGSFVGGMGAGTDDKARGSWNAGVKGLWLTEKQVQTQATTRTSSTAASTMMD